VSVVTITASDLPHLRCDLRLACCVLCKWIFSPV